MDMDEAARHAVEAVTREKRAVRRLVVVAALLTGVLISLHAWQAFEANRTVTSLLTRMRVVECENRQLARLVLAAQRSFGRKFGVVIPRRPGTPRRERCPADDPVFAGTPHADRIFGTPQADFVNARAGNDRVFARTGSDSLFGRQGRDVLEGGRGDDTVYGGAGGDTLYSFTKAARTGDPAADLLVGGPGVDTCYIEREDTARSCERVFLCVASGVCVEQPSEREGP